MRWNARTKERLISWPLYPHSDLPVRLILGDRNLLRSFEQVSIKTVFKKLSDYNNLIYDLSRMFAQLMSCIWFDENKIK